MFIEADEHVFQHLLGVVGYVGAGHSYGIQRVVAIVDVWVVVDFGLQACERCEALETLTEQARPYFVKGGVASVIARSVSDEAIHMYGGNCSQ